VDSVALQSYIHQYEAFTMDYNVLKPRNKTRYVSLFRMYTLLFLIVMSY